MRARKCDRCGNFFDEPSNNQKHSITNISDLDTNTFLNQESAVSHLEILIDFNPTKKSEF